MAILDKFLGQPTEQENATAGKKEVSRTRTVRPMSEEEEQALIKSLRSEGSSKPSEEEATAEPAVNADNSADNAPASIFTESKVQFGIPEVPETPSPIKSLEMSDVPLRDDPGSTSSVDEIIQLNLSKNKVAEMVREAKKVIKLYKATVWADEVEFEKLTGKKPDEKIDEKAWFFDDPTKNKWELKRAEPFDVDLWRLHENSTKIDEEQAVKIASMEERMKGLESAISGLERSMNQLVTIVTNANGALTPAASQQSE